MVLFIYTKLNGNWDRVRSVEQVDWGLIILASLIFAVHTLWNAINWHALMSKSGVDVKLGEQMDVYLRSYMFRYIPGNVAGIMSRAIYNKRHGVSASISLWGWFFENVLYLGLGVLIGSYVLLRSTLQLGILFLFLAVVLLAAIILLIDSYKVKTLFNRYIRPLLPHKIRYEFRSLNISVTDKLNLTARYFLSWAIYSISFVVLLGPANPEKVLLISSINALAWSVGYLSLVTPSGTGVREAVMVFLLSEVIGLDAAHSVIIALLARFVFVLGEIEGFLFFYLYLICRRFLSSLNVRHNPA